MMTANTRINQSFYALALSIAIAIAVAIGEYAIADDKSNQQSHLSTRPNVLLIVSDDQGWGDLSSNGNKNLQTTNFDRIGIEGARFTNFYVCPVCSPTRCELMTGRYHGRCGVNGVTQGRERINLDEYLVSQAFKSAGYRTALIGKWHSGIQHPYHPNDRGFDEFFGFTSGHWGDYFNARLDQNGELRVATGYITDALTNHAIRWLDQSNEPFFLNLTYNAPHSPMQVPDEWWNKFSDMELQSKATDANREDANFTRAALAMVANLDWNVGRIFEALSRAGKLNNTIVIFMSDNGPNSDRYNDQLRGKKGSVDEGGVRSPLLIRYPKLIEQGKVVEQLCGAIDIGVTLADICDVPFPNNVEESHPIDGISLHAALMQSDFVNIPRSIFSTWNGSHSIRRDQYLLRSDGALFDVHLDRRQLTDLRKKEPEVASDMQRELNEFIEQLVRKQSSDDRPYTAGMKLNTSDVLPAQEAELKGNVKYSSIHPNCSYLTNWTDRSDEIAWPIEALSDGLYEFQIEYACSEQSLLQRLSLSIDEDEVASFTFDKAYDPVPYGVEHDRVVRSESLMKSFQLKSIGTIKLSAGKHRIALHANETSGRSFGEIGGLIVKRVEARP
jgi:arylsulfatase A-like enzyme